MISGVDTCVADARKLWGDVKADDLTLEASIVVLKYAQGDL